MQAPRPISHTVSLYLVVTNIILLSEGVQLIRFGHGSSKSNDSAALVMNNKNPTDQYISIAIMLGINRTDTQ